MKYAHAWKWYVTFSGGGQHKENQYAILFLTD